MNEEAAEYDVEEQVEPEEAEQPEPEAEDDEPKAEGEDQPHKVEFSEEQQRVFNETIGKKTAKMREAERAAEQERQRREQLEQELNQLKAPRRPEIPPAPDPYDDDYEQQLAARDEALLKRAQFDAMEQARQQQAQYAQQQAQQEAEQKLNTTVKTYAERAGKLGIKPEDLQRAGSYVGQVGLDDSVARYILNDEQGPSITVYLASNPLELDAIRQMDPMQAAVHIATTVRDRAASSRPKPSLAPDPVESVSGSGLPEGQRGPKGATFE
jgi:hypothetical protein